ncbi:MAG: fused MFS/spermidine synthase [Bdellovibrionales bacterium]
MFYKLVLPVCALTMLVAAGLLFNIQPMIGKMLLPKVGGAPAVWNVALACFQLMLLAGYLLSHLMRKLTAFTHGAVYCFLLVCAAATLPFSLPQNLPEVDSAPTRATAAAIIASVGAVFVALSLTAPTIQRLFAQSRHKEASDPYFLYAASNAGSFIGLLAYPFFIEPNFAVSEQTHLWKHGYWMLLLLAPLCLLLHKPREQTVVSHEAASPVLWKQSWEWILLALLPSSLTLGVTTFVSTDISPTPMLWVGTLALYLATFVIAFARRGAKLRALNLRIFPFIVLAAVATPLLQVRTEAMAMSLQLAAFFSVALACHTKLAEKRPSYEHLTVFYLCLSVGGALGGSFNAFVAPFIFNGFYEYPLALSLAYFVLGRKLTCQLTPKRLALVASILSAFMIVVVAINQVMPLESHVVASLVVMIFALCISLSHCLPKLACCALGVCLALTVGKQFFNDTQFQGRDFFGVISVRDSNDEAKERTLRHMMHGTTTHGVQIVGPLRRTVPTGYYSPETPIGELWNAMRPADIAAVGIGAGTLNCYAKSDDFVHFIDIDPLAVETAQKYFTFVTECPSPLVSIGDGRLVLQSDKRFYDLIVLDAFSSDAIPTHLLTREALEIYLRRLKPNGVLAFHVSSRFFDFEPVLAAAAVDLGLTAYRGRNRKRDESADTLFFGSVWIAMARDGATLRDIIPQNKNWRLAQTQPQIAAWRDDYSSLMRIMNPPPF